jgi:outer membrane receptor protein involved in Fe transport
MQKHALALLYLTTSTLAATAALAQTPQGLETITVTARKRTESLQDVPVAVTAIPKASLENNLASDLNKIGELAPQVSIARALTGTGAAITIRGISSGTVDSGLEQSVSLSVDGVSLSRGRIVETAMFDMQQVEVMQGPQSLFFGKNSPAGVISITTVDPTNTFEGYVRGGYEFKAEEKYAETAISGPITDSLKARLALRYSHMNGWIKNVAPTGPNPFNPAAPLVGPLHGKTGPMGHDLAGRFTLLWEPSDDFTVKFKLTMDSQRLNGNGAYIEPYCTNGRTVPTQQGLPMAGADCKADMVKSEGSLPALYAANYPFGNGGKPYMWSDLGLASLTLNKTFDSFSVTATTGYYDQLHRASHNGDTSPYVLIYDTERERYRLINQEVRLNTDFEGPVNAMVGGYIEHSHRRWLNAPDIFNIINPATGDYTTTITTSDNDSDSYSAFGQLRWKIVPALELAAGVRFTRDEKQSRLLTLANNPLVEAAFGLFPANQVINGRFANNNVSPDVTLTWKPDADQTLYAAYKTGYKAGGISNPALLPATATAANLTFGPEKTKGFEVGYKADLLANTLRVDLTAYRYNYNGLQVTATEPSTTGSFIYTIRNAAKARTYGVTGSFEWLATERLSLNGNFGWNRARYLSFKNSQCYGGQTAATGCVGGVQDLSGRALNRAPDWTFKVGADYKADIAPGWIADLSASAAYNGSYQAAPNYNPGGFQSSFWILNAAIHISPESERYRLSLIGRNLTNSYYKMGAFEQSGADNPLDQFTSTFNRPREIAIQASYKF